MTLLIATSWIIHEPVVVANTMLMYKMRKLRSHFLSHLYAVMHDARPSLCYLCGLVCGLAELEQNSSCAVALYAWRSSVAIYLCGVAVLRSGFRDTERPSLKFRRCISLNAHTKTELAKYNAGFQATKDPDLIHMFIINKLLIIFIYI